MKAEIEIRGVARGFRLIPALKILDRVSPGLAAALACRFVRVDLYANGVYVSTVGLRRR